MKQLPVGIMGIAIANTTMKEVLNEIVKMIEESRTGFNSRYIAAITFDVLVKAHGWNPSHVRNHEILHILRQSCIAVAGGMSIVWLSKLLGSPLKYRITVSDLLPMLSEELGKRKMSLFLLGGDEKANKLCVVYLQALYPDLVIAGSAHPEIYIQGKDLEDSEIKDSYLIELINRTAPDVLMINLGSPKQEIWFERIKNKLRVPVSIGVGGSFELMTGLSAPTPKWMKNLNLEWLYRLIQEPGRLGLRYWIDFFKFNYMTLPLVFFHSFSRLSYYLLSYANRTIYLRSNLLFLSAHKTLTIIPLPPRIDKSISKEIARSLEETFSQDCIILDFTHVRHIDLEGLGLFITLWQKAGREKKQLYGLALHSKAKMLLKLHRIWDLVQYYMCATPVELLTRLNGSGNRSTLYDAIQQDQRHVVISFLGQLDNNQDLLGYLKKITPIIHFKECILDFTYCTYVDNTGLNFLLKLKKLQPGNFTSLKLCCLNKSIRQQFKLSNVEHLFTIVPTLEELLS